MSALGATLLAELAALWFFVRVWPRCHEIAMPKLAFAGIVASSWTLPYLWYLLPRFFAGSGYLIIGESCVVIAEALFYWFVLDLAIGRSLAASVFCNMTSLIVGSVIFDLI